MPQSLAASPRAYPSSTNATPKHPPCRIGVSAACCRKPVAVRSARIIVTAFGIEVSANHDQPAENHTSACLRRPAQSKANAAGISTREASLPTLGQASIRLSDGNMGSNVKISGEGFDCYYYVFKINT